jgi:hypothetical protein
MIHLIHLLINHLIKIKTIERVKQFHRKVKLNLSIKIKAILGNLKRDYYINNNNKIKLKQLFLILNVNLNIHKDHLTKQTNVNFHKIIKQIHNNHIIPKVQH